MNQRVAPEVKQILLPSSVGLTIRYLAGTLFPLFDVEHTTVAFFEASETGCLDCWLVGTKASNSTSCSIKPIPFDR